MKILKLYTNEVMLENIAIYSHLGYVEVDRKTEDDYKRIFLRKTFPTSSDPLSSST